jgi:2,3-bisphosphoglycerate-independent phosphoglycerate mutase
MAETAKHPDTVLLVTADHGNADCMIDPDGSPNTAHSTNPVPFTVCMDGVALASGGRLADIAPTILSVLGIEKPAEMTGNSLIKH